jgi:nifR3 family TIM-barrel protein
MGLYHPVNIGALTIPGNLFLAPVAGYSDRAFRSVCIEPRVGEPGADFTCTEMVSAEALIRNGVRTELMLPRAENEVRYAIQLFGADPAVMYRAALLLAPWRPEAVDINGGCPVPKVVKTGAGSALMRNPERLGHIVEAVVKASKETLGDVPVTVKLRSGWDAASLTYRECGRIAVEAGAALVGLHPRTRSQGYAGKSDWSRISDLASRLAVPVAGSGDLFSPEDAGKMLRETGCAAVLFARGALGNPFIFSATRALLTGETWQEPTPRERLETALHQLILLSRDRGESSACREMRKHFCAYTKGLSGGAALRNRLIHADTVERYRAILALQPDLFLER